MIISGKNIDLRKVAASDAEFILSLRVDPLLNKNLSFVENDLDKQRKWICDNEENSLEWYFIIQNKNSQPVGTVRIYDVKEDSFCWGSWIVKPEARIYASFESAVLLYNYAFFTLGFTQSHFDVRKENKSVINFHLKMGAKIIKEDELNFYFIFKKESYQKKMEEHFKLVNRIFLRKK